MKIRYLLILAIPCTALGILLFLLQRKLLIIHFPSRGFLLPSSGNQHEHSIHKQVRIYYKKHANWHFEEVRILWQETNSTYNLKHLTKQWLAVLQDEHLIPAHVILESVAISSLGNDAYISFDNPIFSLQQSIMLKWLVIESLFKTMLASGISLNTVTLLVKQQPMHDDQLELSLPLPIQEFLATTS